MPHFAIHCLDKPNSADLRAETRPLHLAYIGAKEGDLVAAGPLLDEDGGPIGSLIICAFGSRAEALSFAAADPYAEAGLFSSVTVTSWRQVYPQAS